jgi:glycosyltransferase involved in cell wall biosynthesis
MDLYAACAAVIPCLNEAPTIGSVVAGALRHVQTVIVVNDGSSDQTSELALQAGALVISQPRNMGKGAALQAGWQRARECGVSWILTMDGDGQHAPEDIPRFLERAQQTHAAIVVGNRMADAIQMPWLRRRVNMWMSRRLSAAAGLDLPDSQCGFRLLNLQVLTFLEVRTTHFEIESEVLLACARAGQPIEFVPIRVIYKDEQSKIHPLRDTLRWFRWWRAVR